MKRSAHLPPKRGAGASRVTRHATRREAHLAVAVLSGDERDGQANPPIGAGRRLADRDSSAQGLREVGRLQDDRVSPNQPPGRHLRLDLAQHPARRGDALAARADLCRDRRYSVRALRRPVPRRSIHLGSIHLGEPGGRTAQRGYHQQPNAKAHAPSLVARGSESTDQLPDAPVFAPGEAD